MKVYIVTNNGKTSYGVVGVFEAVYSTYEKAKEAYPNANECESQFSINCIELDTNRHIDEALTEMFLDKVIKCILLGRKGLRALWNGKLKDLELYQGLKIYTQDTTGVDKWFPAVYLGKDLEGDYVFQILDIENTEPFYIYDAFGKQAFSKKYQRIKPVL